MLLEEGLDLLRFVSGEVIENDVDLLLAAALFHDVLQEGDELVTRMMSGRLAVHLSRLHVQSRVQGQRAMPVILKSVALGTAW